MKKTPDTPTRKARKPTTKPTSTLNTMQTDPFPEIPRLLNPGWLNRIGIHGYDQLEDIVLASLVTGDPLLLIGKSGTGKTFLLNALSAALGLEHRHYNASLIAFDDLVGFPFPQNDGASIRYIETPATVWQAESVLIDELSRCKAEHQNRLFSLVHERRIQGLELPRLRYRWAAMNPCEDQDNEDFYEGSVALDRALADRFAFVIEVPDWDTLEEHDRRAIADARSACIVAAEDADLVRAVEQGRQLLRDAAPALHEAALAYASVVATQLLQPGVRLSPRRVQKLSRNLLALTLVNGGRPTRELFLKGFKASLPHLAWGVRVADTAIRGAHAVGWDYLTQGPDARWLSLVLAERDIARRCKLLLSPAPSTDTLTLAIRQSLVNLPKAEAAALAIALMPVVRERAKSFGEESFAAIVDAAAPVLEVEGAVKWRLNGMTNQGRRQHPALEQCKTLVDTLPPARRLRARQLFYYCLTNDIPLPDPAALEQSLDRAITIVREHLQTAA